MGEDVSDAACWRCRFPELLGLAAAAAPSRSWCRQHLGPGTLAQNNKKSHCYKLPRVEQSGSESSRLQSFGESLAYASLMPSKCQGSAQEEHRCKRKVLPGQQPPAWEVGKQQIS